MEQVTFYSEMSRPALGARPYEEGRLSGLVTSYIRTAF